MSKQSTSADWQATYDDMIGSLESATTHDAAMDSLMLLRGFNEGLLSAKAVSPRKFAAMNDFTTSKANEVFAKIPQMPNMNQSLDIGLILEEVTKAVSKFPTWPNDPLHAIAILGEEFGELTKATLQTIYEPHKVKDGELKTEAIQTAAMALRFFVSLQAGQYQWLPSEQHKQEPVK